MPGINVRFAVIVVFAVRMFGADVRQGIADFNQGRYEEAISNLRGSTNPQGKLFLALSQAARNNCAAALPELTQTARTNKLAGLAAAKCLSAGGDAASALSLLADLRKREPSDADILYETAEIEMRAFNDTTFAMYQRAPASYRVHELSAEIFEIENRYEDAVAEYKKAIELNPSAPDLHFRLGRALLLQSHTPAALDEAKAQFEAELKLSPEDPSCEYQLGQIANVQGSSTEAQKHFERALELSPDFVSALIALGRAYSQQKKNQQAIEVLKRATKLEPDNEAAHYALLTAYRNGGDMQDARAEKATLDRLQKPPDGEFSDFLKKLGDKPQQ